jgi:Uma2 family endonuclease
MSDPTRSPTLSPMGERARATTGAMTFDEAARLDADRAGGELDRGAWIPMTRNTWRHGQIVSKISFLLMVWSRDRPEWIVSAGDPGAKLAVSPDVLRGPDVGVTRSERMPTGKGADGWLEGAPELAVEVLGDAQSMADALAKGLEYLAAGARLVWLVDRDAERVVVMTPPDHTRVVGGDAELEGGDVLPGLRIAVREIFTR